MQVCEGFGVVEHQVVHVVKVKDLLPLRGVQLGEIVLRDSGRGPLGIRVPIFEVGEGEVGWRPDAAQQTVGVLLQTLELPDEVVPEQTGAAELADGLPVDVHPNGTPAVQQVLNELPEGDAGAGSQGGACGIGPVPGDDGASKNRMIVQVWTLKLVPEGGDEPLEGLPDEQNPGVGPEPVHDTGERVALQPPQVLGVMHHVVWDVLRGASAAAQNHQDPFPVGAARFGHLAVQQPEPVLHVNPGHLLTGHVPFANDGTVPGAELFQQAEPGLLGRVQLLQNLLSSRGGGLQQQLPVTFGDGLLPVWYRVG